MKFFIATRHSSSPSRSITGIQGLTIHLHEIAIVRDDGVCHFIKRSEHSRVSFRNAVMKLFLGCVNAELFGFNCAESFVAIKSVFNVVDTITDLGQSVIEYMELLENEDFGAGTSFLFVAPADSEGRYTPFNKVQMFYSHKDAPVEIANGNAADDAIWLWKMHHFFTEHKNQTIAKLKLSAIEE